MAMGSAEAVGIIEVAIDYILLMRESSGEERGERELVRNLERVITFPGGQEVKKSRGVQQVQ